MIEKVIKIRTYKDSFRVENVAHLAECLPSVCEILSSQPFGSRGRKIRRSERIIFGSIVGLRPAQSVKDPILKYLNSQRVIDLNVCKLLIFNREGFVRLDILSEHLKCT